MKNDLVIFGIGKIAEVVFYYAKEECGFNVVAFCVDGQYKTVESFQGLPVVAFESVEREFSPSTHDLFVAVGYHDLNRLREAKCKEAIAKGYRLPSIVSPIANLPKNVQLGWNCFVMPPCFIHPCVVLKNNVFVFNGATVGHHSVLEDNCWLTSSCNIGGNVSIGANTFMALNSTVGHSVSIGRTCFIGANALVTKNLEDDKVVIVESSKPLRLNSRQFLRMSKFSSL